jgi:hypothetical protein
MVGFASCWPLKAVGGVLVEDGRCGERGVRDTCIFQIQRQGGGGVGNRSGKLKEPPCGDVMSKGMFPF